MMKVKKEEDSENKERLREVSGMAIRVQSRKGRGKQRKVLYGNWLGICSVQKSTGMYRNICTTE